MLNQMRLATAQSWQHSGVEMRLRILADVSLLTSQPLPAKTTTHGECQHQCCRRLLTASLFSPLSGKFTFLDSISIPVYSIFHLFLLCFSSLFLPYFSPSIVPYAMLCFISIFYYMSKMFSCFPSNILQFTHFELKWHNDNRKQDFRDFK